MLGGRKRLPADHGLDGGESRVDPFGVAAFPERRSELISKDPRADGVREHGLEAVAHFDAHLPIFDEDREKDSVVLLLLTDLPVHEEAIGQIVSILTVERSEDRNHDLIARPLLVVAQVSVDRTAVLRGQKGGVVVEPALVLGWPFGGSGSGVQGGGEQDARRQETPDRQNSTFGALSDPWADSKYAFGLKPKIEATMFRGKDLTIVLKAWATSLNLRRSTAIRFSVPSSWD